MNTRSVGICNLIAILMCVCRLDGSGEGSSISSSEGGAATPGPYPGAAKKTEPGE